MTLDYDPITDALDALDHLGIEHVGPEELRVAAADGQEIRITLAGEEEGWNVLLCDAEGERERVLGIAGERLVELVAALQGFASGGVVPEGCLLCGTADERRLDHDRSELVCVDCLT